MYKKNVAGQFLYFALVNATTGAALTGASVTAKLGIDGAAQASVGGTVTEDAGGQYHLALAQADTNGNDIGFLFTATNAIPVSITIVTTSLNPYDAAAFGMTNLDATVSSRATPAQILTTALSEAYSTLHGTMTLSQLLFEVRSILAEKAISGTTVTAKKLDGSTTAETFTLNDATLPTSITRAT